MTRPKHKVYNILDAQEPVEQAGFLKNNSTIDILDEDAQP